MSFTYGFFNSEYHQETGYDRQYDNETMNRFFKGLVSEYGVFKQVGDAMRVTIPSNRPDAESKMTVLVNPGKALVNGHWALITGDPVEVKIAAATAGKIRKDRVVVRWNEEARKMQILSVTGTPGDYNSSRDGDSILNCPIDDPKGWDPSTKTWVENITDGIAEITLAYVIVRSGATIINVNDIIPEVGGSRCPWIARMTVEPTEGDKRDIANYIAYYHDAFQDWNITVQHKLNLELQVQNKTVAYPGGTSLPITLDHATYLIDKDFDKIDIFLNGRMLREGYDYTVDMQSTKTVVNFPRLGSSLPQGNDIIISVLKGKNLAWPHSLGED